MPTGNSGDDPIKTHARRANAARRVGVGVKCGCGESRPAALIAGRTPAICAECDRKQYGRTAFDSHHVAGRANSPVTIPIPANDHRAELSEPQRLWPTQTLENPDGSPLLAAAACVLGVVDTVRYLFEALLLGIARLLEWLDSYLTQKWGPKWWLGTGLEQFAPMR